MKVTHQLSHLFFRNQLNGTPIEGSSRKNNPRDYPQQNEWKAQKLEGFSSSLTRTKQDKS